MDNLDGIPKDGTVTCDECGATVPNTNAIQKEAHGEGGEVIYWVCKPCEYHENGH